MLRYFIALIAILFIFYFVKRFPYFSPVVYFALIFVRRTFLGKMQVRYQIVYQLVFIVFLLIISSYGYRTKRDTFIKPVDINAFRTAGRIIAIVCVVECINGYIHHYRVFQIMVDVYKVLEIIIFYLFFSRVWRRTDSIKKCIDLILLEMCLLGAVEIFTTHRGGVGLNIAMSLFPIILSTGIYVWKRHYWVIMAFVLVIAFTSKTRTYMIGMIISFFIVLLLSKGRRKGNVICGWVVLFISAFGALAIYLSFNKSAYFQRIIEVIIQLGGSLETSGGYRIYEIQLALTKFLSAPLFGKGYGYMEFVFIKLMGYFEWGDFMHNTYVELLAKTGIFGLILYGGGIIGYLKTQRRLIREAERIGDGYLTGMMIGGYGGTICWMVTYFAAPLSSYGYIFIPGIISLTYYTLYKRELEQSYTRQSA